MTNDVFCVGLTRTELQTLSVLLPITFPILSVEPDALDEELGASAAILWDGLFSCSDARLSEWVLRLLMEHGAAEPSPAGGV